MNLSLFLRLSVLSFILGACVTPAKAQFFRSSNSDRRPGTVGGDVNRLEDSTQQLRVAFDTYLDSRRGSITEEDRRLNQLLGALKEGAESLRRQTNSNSDTEQIYRTFHSIEYELSNCWMYAGEIGYGSSLDPYFVRISDNLESLARQGLRNPRVQKPAPAAGYSPRGGRRTQQQIVAPGAPVIPPQNHEHSGQERRPDVGDFFKRLFR